MQNHNRKVPTQTSAGASNGSTARASTWGDPGTGGGVGGGVGDAWVAYGIADN